MALLPRVAIIVLNYNGEDCLLECLSSLKGLTYQNFQVIVVDNSSQDTSLGKAQEQFPENIYLEKKENAGFARGMNTGIQYALENSFEYVWLMNFDAVVESGALTKMMEEIAKNPHIEAASPVIKTPEGDIWFSGGKVNYLRMRVEHQRDVSSDTPYQTKFLTGCCPIFSSRLLREVKGFDERFFLYYEDADLSIRIRENNIPLFILPDATVIHAENSQSNPRKLYFLVLSGLLFFAIHTPNWLRPYMAIYVTIRRIVNRIKLYLRLFGAEPVAQAYADYINQYQAGHQLYLYKLPKR